MFSMCCCGGGRITPGSCTFSLPTTMFLTKIGPTAGVSPYNDATLVYGPAPAGLTVAGVPLSGSTWWSPAFLYSSAMFNPSSGSITHGTYYYQLTCANTGITVQLSLAEWYLPTSPPADGIHGAIYTWNMATFGNTTSPVSGQIGNSAGVWAGARNNALSITE